jgi:hypothetical protein
MAITTPMPKARNGEESAETFLDRELVLLEARKYINQLRDDQLPDGLTREECCAVMCAAILDSGMN